MKQKKPLLIANWKNQITTITSAEKLFISISKKLGTTTDIETVICPPMIYVGHLGKLVTSRNVVLGTQGLPDVSKSVQTGLITPEMVFNSRARYIILGHSEERVRGITDQQIHDNALGILQQPLIPIICIGETIRDKNHLYYEVIREQIETIVKKFSPEYMSRIVIAYEPIWAIGKNAKRECTPAETMMMIQFIRKTLLDMKYDIKLVQSIPIVFGGSVSPDNAKSYTTIGGADGLLVGRASLDSKTFFSIAKQIFPNKKKNK